MDELFPCFLILVLLFCFVSLQRQVYASSGVVINEFLPHPSTGDNEWVELYIPDSANITGYWIDDDTDFGSDTGNSRKREIT